MNKVLLTHAKQQYKTGLIGGGRGNKKMKLNKNKQKTDWGGRRKSCMQTENLLTIKCMGILDSILQENRKFIACSEIYGIYRMFVLKSCQQFRPLITDWQTD
jgi:hypothetical protein